MHSSSTSRTTTIIFLYSASTEKQLLGQRTWIYWVMRELKNYWDSVDMLNLLQKLRKQKHRSKPMPILREVHKNHKPNHQESTLSTPSQVHLCLIALTHRLVLTPVLKWHLQLRSYKSILWIWSEVNLQSYFQTLTRIWIHLQRMKKSKMNLFFLRREPLYKPHKKTNHNRWKVLKQTTQAT